MLSWLLVGHAAGDFLFQNRWMAENKGREMGPLTAHCVVYTIMIALFALPAGGIHYCSVAVILVSHLVLDRRGFASWWASRVTKSGETQWLVVMIDQAWHLVVLASVCLMETFFRRCQI